MWYVRGWVCAFAMLLSAAAFAEDQQGAVEKEIPKGIKELLNSEAAERFKSYLNQRLMESEQLSRYVDRDYWRSIRSKFDARVAEVIAEDEFIQAILPILQNVQAELRELLTLTVQELLERGEGIATKLHSAAELWREKGSVLVEQAVLEIKQLVELMPEEYQALIAKIGDTVGSVASNVTEETTLLVASILSTATSSIQRSTP